MSESSSFRSTSSITRRFGNSPIRSSDRGCSCSWGSSGTTTPISLGTPTGSRGEGLNGSSTSNFSTVTRVSYGFTVGTNGTAGKRTNGSSRGNERDAREHARQGELSRKVSRSCHAKCHATSNNYIPGRSRSVLSILRKTFFRCLLPSSLHGSREATKS